MKLKSALKSNKFRWAMTVVSVVLSIVTLVSLFVGLSNLQETKTMQNSAYHIGTIDDSGKVVESRQFIYSDIATTENMKIEIAEDGTITYKVVFYDESKDFVSASDFLEVDFDTTSTPTTAKYFRVLITPYQVDGENVTINIFNITKYVNMLSVSYANN